MKADNSYNDFRIEEYSDHFRVAKKYEINEYWKLLWLYPLFVKEVKVVWRVKLKNNNTLNMSNCFDFEMYHFKNKEECVKWIEDYKKYPIYHYYLNSNKEIS